MVTSIHPRHVSRRMDREHTKIAGRFGPSAREMFARRLDDQNVSILALGLTVPQLRAVKTFERFGFIARAMMSKLAAKGIMRTKPDGEYVELTPLGLAIARRGERITGMSVGKLVTL